MEQREEIKSGVKQKVIEFMAEQITREDSFSSLKSELITEFFSKKEIKIENSSTPGNLSSFEFVATKAEDSLQKIKDRQAEYYKKIIDVKLGKNTNINIQKIIKQLQDKDSTSYADILQQLDGKNIPDYNDFIIDPKLKSDFTEGNKQRFRDSSLSIMKEIMANPFSDTLSSTIRYYTNEHNYRKEYNVSDKNINFTFECSYVYNSITNQKYIDSILVDSKGFLLTGDELGIPFAIDAMELMDKSEVVRQKAIKNLERKTKTTLPKKNHIAKKTIVNLLPTRKKKTVAEKTVKNKK